jgi:hypothetical protein
MVFSHQTLRVESGNALMGTKALRSEPCYLSMVTRGARDRFGSLG